MFSCKFCQISKNPLFTEHPRWLLLLSDHFIARSFVEHQSDIVVIHGGSNNNTHSRVDLRATASDRSSHQRCSMVKTVLKHFFLQYTTLILHLRWMFIVLQCFNRNRNRGYVIRFEKTYHKLLADHKFTHKIKGILLD